MTDQPALPPSRGLTPPPIAKPIKVSDSTWSTARRIDKEQSVDLECPVSLRLNATRSELQVRMADEARYLPRIMLVTLTQEMCDHLGISLSTDEAEEIVSLSAENEWRTVLKGVEPIVPTDARVELLIDVHTPASDHGNKNALIRAHAPIARLHAGKSGVPGKDIRGDLIPVRPPREARLPIGVNTYVDGQGTVLLAQCDGEVRLTNLQLHVDAATIIDTSDLTSVDGDYSYQGNVFLVGSVEAKGTRRLTFEATGDVHVIGDFWYGRITAGGDISVTGGVLGDRDRIVQITAGGSVTCDHVVHGVLKARKDIRLAEARLSVLVAGNKLIVPRRIKESVIDCTLKIEGGVRVVVPPEPEKILSTNRQYFRVPVDMAAEVARYGVDPVEFWPGNFGDLSPQGAKLRLTRNVLATVPQGALLHVRFLLSNDELPIIGLARVARSSGHQTIGLNFVDLTSHDRARLTEFCQAVNRSHPTLVAASEKDRQVDTGGSA